MRGKCHLSGKGTDVDNGAGAAFTHAWQNRLCNGDETKVIRFEHPSEHFQRRFFDRTTAGNTVIVDQDIYPAFRRKHAADGILY